MTDVIRRIQAWYEAQCDGDWEHQHGVKIDTLDNPGWSVTIDLPGTPLAGKPFPEVKELDPGREWIHCVVEGDQFLGHGGPPMLSRILETFLDWASSTAG